MTACTRVPGRHIDGLDYEVVHVVNGQYLVEMDDANFLRAWPLEFDRDIQSEEQAVQYGLDILDNQPAEEVEDTAAWLESDLRAKNEWPVLT
jgi:hypothetical protein